MGKLTLAMIVKNESRCLARCLESVSGIVDEIVIVDTGSTDNTKEIAEQYNAKIFDFKWRDDFSAARNYALEQSTGDWNLVLDADEYIANDCKKAISEFIEGDRNVVGRIRIISNFVKDNQVKYSSCYIARLAAKGVMFDGKIHEQLGSELDRINLNVDVNHDGYFETDKSGRNLDILLKEERKRPNDCYVLYQIAKTYNISKNYLEANRYFKKCYKLLEKRAGYRYNVIIDYMYNIVAVKDFGKGLEVIKNEKESLSDNPDFHFVCGMFYMDLILSDIAKYMHYIPLIEKEYLACLEIGETVKYDSVCGIGTFLASYNLGTFYEVTGDKIKAKYYYEMSAKYGYEKAAERLAMLK